MTQPDPSLAAAPPPRAPVHSRLRALGVQASIVRIVGVFELGSDRAARARTDQALKRAGFAPVEVDEDSRRVFRNLFYPEFADLMFLGGRGGSATVLGRDVGLRLALPAGGDRAAQPFTLQLAEVFLFPEPALGVFAVEIAADGPSDLGALSDLTGRLRSFNARLTREGAAEPVELARLLESDVLGGIALSGPDVRVDDYSGSKFRVFSVVDVVEGLDAAARRQVLYDLACGVPLGAAAGENDFAPSDAYYESLMSNAVSAFRNYEALAVLDACTVVGTGLLARPFARETWGTTYFRLYVFNLFVKYALHHYAARSESPVALRARFNVFLRDYDVGRVTFNFLPEMLYDAIRRALGVDGELARLRDRITALSAAIAEEHQKRANQLLAVVSGLSSLSGAGAVLGGVHVAQERLGWSAAAFWGLGGALLVTIGAAVLGYLFPERREKWLGR